MPGAGRRSSRRGCGVGIYRPPEGRIVVVDVRRGDLVELARRIHPTKTLKTLALEGQIHCPEPGCGPFSSFASGHHRQGVVEVSAYFRHPSHRRCDGGSEESIQHLLSKHAIADWFEDTCDDVAMVSVEEWELETDAGPLRPDVFVQLRDGSRIAVEVQRSAGSAKEVHDKELAYRQAGIVCWWVFLPGDHTWRLGGDTSTVVPNPAQEQLVKLKAELLGFDIEAGAFLVPYSRGYEWGRAGDARIKTTRTRVKSPYLGRASKGRPWTLFFAEDRIAACRIDSDRRLGGRTKNRIRREVAEAQLELRDLIRDADIRRRVAEWMAVSVPPPPPSGGDGASEPS